MKNVTCRYLQHPFAQRTFRVCSEKSKVENGRRPAAGSSLQGFLVSPFSPLDHLCTPGQRSHLAASACFTKAGWSLWLAYALINRLGGKKGRKCHSRFLSAFTKPWILSRKGWSTKSITLREVRIWMLLASIRIYSLCVQRHDVAVAVRSKDFFRASSAILDSLVSASLRQVLRCFDLLAWDMHFLYLPRYISVSFSVSFPVSFCIFMFFELWVSLSHRHGTGSSPCEALTKGCAGGLSETASPSVGQTDKAMTCWHKVFSWASAALASDSFSQWTWTNQIAAFAYRSYMVLGVLGGPWGSFDPGFCGNGLTAQSDPWGLRCSKFAQRRTVGIATSCRSVYSRQPW